MKKSSLLHIIFILFVLASCHSPIPDESYYQYEKKAILNAVLQPDSLIKVHLSFNCGLKDTVIPLIENATVIIQAANTMKDTLRYTGKGWYESKYTAGYNVTYNCTIEIPDYPFLFASTTTPGKTIVDQIEITETANMDEEGNSITSVSFNILNSSDETKYWEIKLTNKGYVYTMDGDSIYRVKDNNIFLNAGQDEVLQNEALPLSVFSNKRMKGDTYKVTFYFTKISVQKHDLFLELRTIDESYYYYQKDFYLYNTSGGVGLGTSPQSYPLYTNVLNGLGIFTSYTSFIQPIDLRE